MCLELQTSDSQIQPSALVITKNNGAVDHLLHAIGIIFGNTVTPCQHNNVQINVVNSVLSSSRSTDVISTRPEEALPQNVSSSLVLYPVETVGKVLKVLNVLWIQAFVSIFVFIVFNFL